MVRIQNAAAEIGQRAADAFARGEIGHAATHVILSADRYYDVQRFVSEAFRKRREASASGRFETEADGSKVDIDPSYDPEWPTRVFGLEILVLPELHTARVMSDPRQPDEGPVMPEWTAGGCLYDFVAVVCADPRVTLGDVRRA